MYATILLIHSVIKAASVCVCLDVARGSAPGAVPQSAAAWELHPLSHGQAAEVRAQPTGSGPAGPPARAKPRHTPLRRAGCQTPLPHHSSRQGRQQGRAAGL